MRKLNSLKLLLSALLLAIGCNVWGADAVYVELCTSWNQTLAYNSAYTHDYTINNLNGGTTTMTLGVQGVYRQSNGSTYFQMNKKTGYFRNTTKLPGKIVKIETTWNNTSGATKCYFAANSQATSSDATVTKTAAASVTFTPASGTDYYYFNLDVSSGSASSQMTSCKVYYETSGGGSDPVDASWSVDPESVTVMESKTATATITTNYDGTLSVTSNATGTATATISNKIITVTGVAAGTTTLTVTGAATSSYNAISKTISVTVTANARPVGEIFYESFNTNEGTGGNDGLWSGSIASSTIKSDNTGWTFASAKGANQCAKFGAGSSLGSATTPALNYVGDAVLTFKAAAWNGKDENTTLNLSVLNGGSISSATVTMVKGQWTEYTVNLTNLTATSNVKFEGYEDSNSRFFLDEVSIVKIGTLSLVAQEGTDYYATFSNANPVQFDEATTVYTVSVDGSTISLISVESKQVPASTGVLIKSTANSVKYTYIASAEALENNLLKPASEEMTGNYKFYKLAYDDYDEKSDLGFYYGAAEGGAFDAKEGGAYLAVPTSSESDAPARFVFGAPQTPTDIENIAEQGAAQKVLINGQVFILRGEKLFDTVGREVK